MMNNIYTDLNDCLERIDLLESIRRDSGLSTVKAEQLRVLYGVAQRLTDEGS